MARIIVDQTSSVTQSCGHSYHESKPGLSVIVTQRSKHCHSKGQLINCKELSKENLTYLSCNKDRAGKLGIFGNFTYNSLFGICTSVYSKKKLKLLRLAVPQ